MFLPRFYVAHCCTHMFFEPSIYTCCPSFRIYARSIPRDPAMSKNGPGFHRSVKVPGPSTGRSPGGAPRFFEKRPPLHPPSERTCSRPLPNEAGGSALSKILFDGRRPPRPPSVQWPDTTPPPRTPLNCGAPC